MMILLFRGKTEQAIRNAVSKLPDRVKSIGNLVLVNRSTELYKIASRATQYGDFMARAVYYQHLLKQGMEHDQIIRQVNEEFINYNFLPGRLRSGLERSGITWFWSYKIRSIKIMLQMMRKNPFRTLVMNGIIPDLGGPVQDNIFNTVAEGRLDHSIGWDQILNSASLNPAVNFLND